MKEGILELSRGTELGPKEIGRFCNRLAERTGGGHYCGTKSMYLAALVDIFV